MVMPVMSIDVDEPARVKPSILVLGGGNALGAYHAGAWSALEERGIIPDWVVGTSIGAVTAAIIAGTAPDRRDEALRRFWHRASAFDATGFLPGPLRLPMQYAHALASKLLGRLPLFTLRPPDPSGGDERPSMFDPGPMRRLLAELIDFDLLNGGEMRVTVVATDLASGEEVVFDTGTDRIGLDHVMASAALIPDLPPVEVDGRLLVDGGLRANLPLHLVLEELLTSERDRRSGCLAVDLFPLSAPLPRGVLQAAQRQSDLMFASQTGWTLRNASRAWAGRAPGVDVLLMAYQAIADETALKSFDFSAGSLERRRDAGHRDMRRLIDLWSQRETAGQGLRILQLSNEDQQPSDRDGAFKSFSGASRPASHVKLAQQEAGDDC
jgi:NTE family protein